LGIIGRPLGHSFSKRYFEERHGVEYLEFELGSIDELPAVLAAHPNLAGFNVTIPYKVEVMRFLDEVSPEARAIGAVNCVSIDSDGRSVGHNTDAHGFGVGLEKLFDGRHVEVKALVLGSGGAAKAVLHVLTQIGIEHTTVSRNPAAGVIAYGDLPPEIVGDHKLIINTTPLGMWPDVNGRPELPYDALGTKHYLYDLVYNPAETAFMREGARRGAATIGGEEMLLAQAERNWEIWNK
jgi:shikimate dehydrogenase